MFYVYEWYNVQNGEIFYVGKGTGNRYKQTSQRNLLFKTYYENNECAVRIVRYFEQEEDAFSYEHSRILELKKSGMCSCNLDNGGTGGVQFVWTDEMRKYKSLYNPMKEPSQRERMSSQNPMHNKETAKKVGHSKSKIVCYEGKETTCREIADRKKIHIATAQRWCKRGYDTDGNPCYYKDEPLNAKKKTTCSKEVYIDGILFPSLRSAAVYLGIKDTSPLCKALKENRTYKGHKCEYANQQPSGVNSKDNNCNTEGSTTNG